MMSKEESLLYSFSFREHAEKDTTKQISVARKQIEQRDKKKCEPKKEELKLLNRVTARVGRKSSWKLSIVCFWLDDDACERYKNNAT